MINLETNTQLPGESDAEHVARTLALALNGLCDKELSPVFQVGQTFIVMIGDHADSDQGFCWCQPTMEPCPDGAAHKHVTHKDQAN